jgi:hypothetical protein
LSLPSKGRPSRQGNNRKPQTSSPRPIAALVATRWPASTTAPDRPGLWAFGGQSYAVIDFKNAASRNYEACRRKHVTLLSSTGGSHHRPFRKSKNFIPNEARMARQRLG